MYRTYSLPTLIQHPLLPQQLSLVYHCEPADTRLPFLRALSPALLPRKTFVHPVSTPRQHATPTSLAAVLRYFPFFPYSSLAVPQCQLVQVHSA